MGDRQLESGGGAVSSPGSPDRRDFLKIGGAASAVVVLSACGVRVNMGTFPVGEASRFAVGSATLVEDGPFIIARDEQGLYAMTARCTHMGCQLNVDGQALSCRCHGSAFDLHGQVTQGPARRPLDHYRVTVGEGGVTVDTSSTVDAGVRTPVEG